MISDKIITLMLIDDHPTLREGIVNAVTNSGRLKVIREYGNAEDAIADNKSKPPDVIVLDILLPGMNGIEALDLLKAKYPASSVLAYTQTSGIQGKLQQIGFNGYITKGDPTDKLIEVLDILGAGGTYFPAKMQKEQRFTPTEKIIIRLIEDGKTNTEISNLLFNSPSTIKKHKENIYDKMGVKNAAGLIKYIKVYGTE